MSSEFINEIIIDESTVNAVIFARLIFRVSQLKNIFAGC